MNIYDYHFLNQLVHLPFIDAIWLFGSRARGDAGERSDLDLAIVCPSASEKDWHHILQIIDEADTLLKIDCIRFDQLADNDPLKKNILQFKKVLFQREGGYMEKEFWKDYFESLGDALSRLKETVECKDDVDYLPDATIQRFEFCIELYWKVLKKFLAYEKIDAVTPRDTIQKAFQYGFIDNGDIWLQMLDDRNETSHVYKEEVSKRIFHHIRTYWPVLEANYKKLQKRFYGS